MRIISDPSEQLTVEELIERLKRLPLNAVVYAKGKVIGAEYFSTGHFVSIEVKHETIQRS
jgi:hypothetical protein